MPRLLAVINSTQYFNILSNIILIGFVLYSINEYFKMIDIWCLTPLSAIFRPYRGDQFLVVEEAAVPGENH